MSVPGALNRGEPSEAELVSRIVSQPIDVVRILHRRTRELPAIHPSAAGARVDSPIKTSSPTISEGVAHDRMQLAADRKRQGFAASFIRNFSTCP